MKGKPKRKEKEENNRKDIKEAVHLLRGSVDYSLLETKKERKEKKKRMKAKEERN